VGTGSRCTGYRDFVIRGRPIALAGLALTLAAVPAACSGDESAPAAAPKSRVRSCPAAWKAGWQRLANRIGAAVYCPTWMPNPLDGRIGGEWDNGVSVGRDRRYLVSFLWHEPPAQDVHVNFRGYPGRARIPKCEDVQVVSGKPRRRSIPCFSDPSPARRIGGLLVTPYTVNRDADQWHVLYAWRTRGTLYAVSEHVAPPLTYRRVVANLDRLVRGLVRIEPT
jgi:hypothetical protein